MVHIKDKGVAIIMPQLYPCKTGGVEVFYYYLIPKLAQYYQILIFSNCVYEIKKENIQFFNLNKKIVPNKTVSTHFNIFFSIIKKRKEIGVILIPYMSTSAMAIPMLLSYGPILVLSILFRIPYIISIHGGALYPWKPKIMHKIFFERAKKITAVSKSIKKEYEIRVNKKIEIILPLVPFNISENPKLDLKKKYGFEAQDKIILSVGSIKKNKGSDILLNAFFRLGIDYIKKNKLYLLYAGDGPMKNSLEDMAKKSFLKNHVKFIGKVPHENISEVYKLSDVYVISSFFEGTPISLLEAMFNGLTIIGSNVKGINNIIVHKETGLLFKNKNPVDLANNLSIVVEKSHLSIKLGKKAKEYYKKNYNYDNIIEKHFNIFNEILKF